MHPARSQTCRIGQSNWNTSPISPTATGCGCGGHLIVLFCRPCSAHSRGTRFRRSQTPHTLTSHCPTKPTCTRELNRLATMPLHTSSITITLAYRRTKTRSTRGSGDIPQVVRSSPVLRLVPCSVPQLLTGMEFPFTTSLFNHASHHPFSQATQSCLVAPPVNRRKMTGGATRGERPPGRHAEEGTWQ